MKTLTMNEFLNYLIDSRVIGINFIQSDLDIESIKGRDIFKSIEEKNELNFEKNKDAFSMMNLNDLNIYPNSLSHPLYNNRPLI